MVVPARSRPCFSPVLAFSGIEALWKPLADVPWSIFAPSLLRRNFLAFSLSGVFSREWSVELIFRVVWVCVRCGCVGFGGGLGGGPYHWYKYPLSFHSVCNSFGYAACGALGRRSLVQGGGWVSVRERGEGGRWVPRVLVCRLVCALPCLGFPSFVVFFVLGLPGDAAWCSWSRFGRIWGIELGVVCYVAVLRTFVFVVAALSSFPFVLRVHFVFRVVCGGAFRLLSVGGGCVVRRGASL